MSLFKPFIYTEEYADKYFDSKQKPDRKVLAIMLEDKPIGEIQLKQIDYDKKECELSIHMQNDSYKGKGYELLRRNGRLIMPFQSLVWLLSMLIR